MTAVAEDIARRAREWLLEGKSAGDAERALYENVVLYILYNRFESDLRKYIESAQDAEVSMLRPIECYDAFCRDLAGYLDIPGITFPSLSERDHLFACFFQLRRAFHHIFDNIIGGSSVSAKLRAETWQSIFTCDMARYRRVLYSRMNDVATLITGPSGTGKELVARAIAFSGYIPFDARHKRPAVEFASCYCPVNLSELSPTLIESGLFGHVKGAFTGAIGDRAGFFETCHENGAVFLDEMGELDRFIQVKLLRVFQDRTFRRIGETKSRPFRGKIITATNRDLAKAVQAGQFREDLYYRLCSDTIVTPSLREQVAESPEQLRNLLRFIARRVVGEAEAETLAGEAETWIAANLPVDYPWPGNVRELEQCVRNVMVRNAYVPAPAARGGDGDGYIEAIRNCALTANRLIEGYCLRVYEETGSYSAAARRLGLDRRTVKSYVDSATASR
jgi:transcriptional regulator of acetoin/glycerol metabolism